MTALVLPVRPSPRPGEPLTSYAARLADANGIHRDRVLPRHRHDIDVPHTEMAAVAALAGLDATSTGQLTMNRYPLAIRGHGPTRRRGWRLHSDVTWICPSCTLSTGHADLLWQTALMPVCLHCGCYLIRADDPHVTNPAHPRVLELAAILADAAEASIEDLKHRPLLYRLRRRCQALAATINNEHPPRDPNLPAIDLRAARTWDAYPSPDPGTVATLLVLAGGPLIRDKSASSPRPAHPRRHQAAECTALDRTRLAWFLTRMRRHITRDGLHPGHIPTMLPWPSTSEQPRRPGQWLSLTRAATALHLLISHAADQPCTPEAAMAALGVPGIPSCLLIEAAHAGRGLREQDADLLAAAIDALLADGLVDYRRRRDTLRPLTRLPKRGLPPLPATTSRDHTPEQLALGWIWTRFTHGPMRSSPWPDIPDRDVHAFDDRIDPETRLLLHETGQQLLADADLLTIPATETTWAGITRRYG